MPFTDRDTYHTPSDQKLRLLARLVPWPEVAFYTGVLGVVFRASARASLGRYDDRAWERSSLAVLRAMERAGLRFTVEGLEHLRALPGPVVFVGNHMSTLETFALPAFIRPVAPVTYVVKESLLRYPVFGPIMRSRDPIAVGRSNPREDLAAVLRGGEERLGRGISVIVFPQTTRSFRFEPQRFNSIGAKLAVRARVPVMPVALRSDAWGSGRRIKDFGRIDPSLPVRIRFGPPIRPEGRGAEAQRQVVSFLRGAMEEWGVPVAGGESE